MKVDVVPVVVVELSVEYTGVGRRRGQAVDVRPASNDDKLRRVDVNATGPPAATAPLRWRQSNQPRQCLGWASSSTPPTGSPPGRGLQEHSLFPPAQARSCEDLLAARGAEGRVAHVVPASGCDCPPLARRGELRHPAPVRAPGRTERSAARRRRRPQRWIPGPLARLRGSSPALAVGS